MTCSPAVRTASRATGAGPPPLVALVAAVAAVALGTAGCRAGGGLAGKARSVAAERRAQAARAARDAGLGEEVAAFLGTAAAAVGERFTVVYGSGDGGTVTVAQDPPRRRVDVAGGKLGGVVRTAVVNDDGSFSCERRDGAASCVPSSTPPPEVGPFAPTDLERTVSSLSAGSRSFQIEVVRRTVAGAAASCLVTTRRPDVAADPDLAPRGELCIARSTGAPLLVDQPDQRLTASSYRPSVAEDAFRLPAPVATTTPTTRSG